MRFFLIFIVFISFPSHAFELCKCNPDDTHENMVRRAFSIFTGTVRDMDTDFNRERVVIEFDVDKSWRGVSNDEIKVYTDRRGVHALIKEGITCGYKFKRGQKYLVYSYRKKNRRGPASVSKCGGTKPVAEAEEEIKLLGEPVESW